MKKESLNNILKQVAFGLVTFLLLWLFWFFVSISQSPYGMGFELRQMTRGNLEGYNYIVNNISEVCSNLSTRQEGLCIHRMIGKEIGYNYSNCTGNYLKVKDGGCCRDWTPFIGKVYEKFKWDTIYVTYPSLHHVRLDASKNNTYCVIDISNIICNEVEG